jgi:hypothetical protein
MKTIHLNAVGVLELNEAEMREVDGGLIKEIAAAAIDLFENWDTYVASFKQGFNAGQKFAS